MRARTYSPELGRFLQPDPSRQDAQLFVYVGNGPVSAVDPSGLKSGPSFALYDRILAYMFKEMQSNIGHFPNPHYLPFPLAQAVYVAFMANVLSVWDHKGRLRSMYGCKSCSFYTPIRGYNSKYRLKFDVWSNIHYGYVGSEIGFYPDELLFYAANFPGSTSPKADELSIKIGISLWYTYHRGLKASHIQSAIVSNMGTYRKLGWTQKV
jgi:hypothetical protein